MNLKAVLSPGKMPLTATIVHVDELYELLNHQDRQEQLFFWMHFYLLLTQGSSTVAKETSSY